MEKLTGKLFFNTLGFLCRRTSFHRVTALFCTNSSSPKKNLYSVLGVTPKATVEEIKDAYYRLSQVYHPDKHGGDRTSTEKFVEVKEAHELLSNPVEREKYDAEIFPKHSQNSYTATSVKKEFKFHFYRPKKDPYAGYSDWEDVKNVTRTRVSNFLDQQRRRSARVVEKRKRRHIAQKCAYNHYNGSQVHANIMSKTSRQMCKLPK